MIIRSREAYAQMEGTLPEMIEFTACIWIKIYYQVTIHKFLDLLNIRP
jgi:hypothetical protein